MKILYIITQADGGGAQHYVLQMARHFGGSIAAGMEDSKLFETAEKIGIACHPLKHLKRNIRPVSDFLALLEIILLVQKLNPDIVHLNSSKAGFIGSLIKFFVKSKIVYTAHGFIFNEPMNSLKKQFYFALEKFASLFRDHIIAVSDYDRRSAIANRLLPPSKITTVHNGIQPITFLAKDEARSQLGLAQHLFVFGTIANFYKTKGIDVLISAVALLPREIIDKSLWVVLGEGIERKNLELGIMNYGLQKTILLPGNAANAKLLLKAFDVFVLPSRKEGFSYVLLEAMQAGLPIIATNAGGNPEAIGSESACIAPENPAELTERMHKLFIDQAERSRLSEIALERSKMFTEEKMFSETEAVYRPLIRG